MYTTCQRPASQQAEHPCSQVTDSAPKKEDLQNTGTWTWRIFSITLKCYTTLSEVTTTSFVSARKPLKRPHREERQVYRSVVTSQHRCTRGYPFKVSPAGTSHRKGYAFVDGRLLCIARRCNVSLSTEVDRFTISGSRSEPMCGALFLTALYPEKRQQA